MTERVFDLGFLNFREEWQKASEIIESQLAQPTVRLVGRAPKSGKSEFLLEIHRRHRHLLTAIVDVQALDCTPAQIVRDLKRQLGIPYFAPVVPEINSKMVSGRRSRFSHTTINVGPGTVYEHAEIQQSLAAILEKLGAYGTRSLLLVDGLDRSRSDVHSFVMQELLQGIAVCRDTVVFVTCHDEVEFQGVASLNCYTIVLPEIEQTTFLEACAQLGIRASRAQLEGAYLASDRTVGSILNAIKNLSRNT